ncbi:hypothetical protein M0805_009110 [Coniferiporia weirii]|nr:hypothetical protein M0805_009110 [Coniferiporia weirii]
MLRCAGIRAATAATSRLRLLKPAHRLVLIPISHRSISTRMASSALSDSIPAAADLDSRSGTPKPQMPSPQVIEQAQPSVELEQAEVPGSRSPQRTLDFHSGPLVWIDLEMTGLDPKVDKIMEIAVLITDGNLELVDDGIQFVVHVDKEDLDRMDEWCTRQHGLTGLTQACLDSPHSLSSVEEAVLKYVEQHIPKGRIGVLAGNSVHVDKTFLVDQMPSLLKHLHYRIVDVSSIKELCRRWYPGVSAPRTVAECDAHRALDDIHGSIQELRWYRENIFVRPESLTPTVTSNGSKN